MPHHPKGHFMTKKLEKVPKQNIKEAAKGQARESISEGLQEMGKQILAEKLTKKADKQILAEKLTKNPINMKYGKGPHMGHSPAEMGHSPAEMSPFKGHCGPMKMESNKQEKYNLEHDNPVAKHASWMSKFAGNSRMSPMNMDHGSPAKNLGHGMDDMSPEKGAHRKYHLKQRMSKKSKESVGSKDSMAEMVKTEAVMDRFGTNYTGLKKS